MLLIALASRGQNWAWLHLQPLKPANKSAASWLSSDPRATPRCDPGRLYRERAKSRACRGAKQRCPRQGARHGEGANSGWRCLQPCRQALSFLSCLCGRQPPAVPDKANALFLSCLCGRQLVPRRRVSEGVFLSCLCGRQLLNSVNYEVLEFLSCLCGRQRGLC